MTEYNVHNFQGNCFVTKNFCQVHNISNVTLIVN